MPSRWVIHAATMRLGGPTSEDIIRRATASTLAKADELGAKSLALVAFGTGVGGFPLEDAARVEVEEVRRHLERRLRARARRLRRPRRGRQGGVRRRARIVSLADELAAAGGVAAPPQATARLRDLLADALRHGERELGQKRSGTREAPVTVALAADGERLLAAVPVTAALHADAEALSERAWLLVAAVVGALVGLAEPGAPTGPEALAVRAADGPAGQALLGYPGAGFDPRTLEELGPLAFEEQVEGIDRLRARALVVPARRARRGRPPARADRLAPPAADRRGRRAARRPPGGPALGRGPRGRRAGRLGAREAHTRAHDDPDPARRVARRILQRLDGMGKWGGYHTDFAHLARGFAGNDRQLASEVGEALLAAGLLAEKPSVGQRHVFLNPRRAGDIRRLIERARSLQD